MADVIVVGAGLIGMLTARELQRRGASVLLLERGCAGGESTWAGGGILSPLYPWRYHEAVNALALAGHQLWPRIADELLADSGVDPEYTRSGLLVLDQHENATAQQWAQHAGMALEILGASALQAVAAGLNSNIKAALWLPQIAQIRNPRLVKAMIGSLRQRGIACLENTDVIALDIQQGRIGGVQTRDQHYAADQVVIAGGAWSANIIQSYAKPPQVQPVKGQMILFKAEPGQLQTMVLSQGRYLIPRRDGRILAGSTLEYAGFDKTTTDSAHQALRDMALSLVPELATAPVEHHWSGLRPGSEQGIPYICEHPQIAGLYINSGHFRNGVILGAASAALLADIMTRSETARSNTALGNTTINPAFYRFEAQH